MALRIISSAQITLSNVFDSFNVVVSNENFSIACDDTGIPLSGEIGQNGKAISTISVYRVNTKLTPVSSNPSANQFSISIANQINCQGAKKDNDKIYINTLSNGVTGKIVVNINIEGNNTVTKEITFFKTLNSLSDLIDGKFVFGLSNWTNAQNGTGDIGSNVKIIDSNLSTYTGKLLEVTNEKWFYNKKTIDVEDNKIYEFKIRFKQSIDNTTGGKHSYFGYTPYNSAGNAFGTNGSNNMYLINGEQLSTTSWREATFYLSKTALPELNSGGKVIRPAVSAFPTGTVKFRPMFIVNYQGGNGVALVDYCLVQDVSDKFNIKELDYKTTVLESKNGEINAAVNKIRTFAQLSNNPISLAAKVNYAAYDSPNDGEVYVHGLNSQKKAADIDGSCLWQDNQITLPKQMFNPNGLVPEQTAIFMVRSTADNKWYSVWKDGTTWKRVAADVTTNNTISTFTPSDTTDIFIGYYVTRKSNNQNGETPIDVAQIFTGALDYRQASSMSFASSISQMKIIEDEVSLKSSKDEMLMGVNKWKRTKYRKTLANSSAYPTFNDIANLTPIAQDEVRDSTNLVAGMTGDDHFILHFFTNVFVKSAKNISITGNNVDDTATFFVNGVEAGRINTSETVTMSLKAGWNTLEILFYEHDGGESMNINTNISSLVDNMAYAIGGQSSAITLTPNQIDIMSKNINLTGKVTIDSLASGMRDMFSTENGKTVIDGGHIKTGSINADNISTGTLNADRLNIGGVINKINADGSHTISGNKVTINGQGISSVFSTKTELNQKFDNLQIGGRNLIRKNNISTYRSTLVSFDEATNTYTFRIANGADNTWGAGITIVNSNSPIPYGRDYICSFEILVPIDCTWNVDHNFFPIGSNNWQNNDNDNVSKRNTSSKSLKANVWTKCWYSTNNSHASNTNKLDIRDGSNFGVINTSGGDMTFKIRNIKGELGNKPTEWTPAPEDVDAAVKQAQKTANDANQMFANMASDSKLTPAEKKNTKTEWQNINNEYSRIRQQAINVGVTTTAYDNSYNTLNTYLTNLLSNMNTTSDIDNNYKNNFTNYYNARQDLLKAVSDKLNNNINNIQVGSRNLLLKDDCDLTKWTIPSFKERFDISFNNYNNVLNYKNTGGGWEVIYRQINVTPNQEYILSFDYKVYSQFGLLDGCQYGLEISTSTPSNNSTSNVIGKHVIENSPTSLKRASIKFTPTVSTIYLVINGGYISDGLSNIKFDFNKFKLEKGNKVTDWSPAPEDTITKISSIETEFNQTKKEITGRVTKTETDINNLSRGSSQNLLYNSDFLIMNGNLPDGWSTNSNVSFDKGTTTLDGIGTFWYDVTGLTSDSWRAAYSPFVKARKGEIFTASAYVLGYQSWSTLDNGGVIEIEFWNDSSRLSTCASYFDKTKTDWQRVVVTGTCPNETTRVRMRVHPIRNGRFNMSKPMLQVGSIATGWQRGFNAQDITTRLTSAESKITDTAITNTIKNSNTFYTKDDINAKGYQTSSQVQQTVDALQLKFQQSGGYNLLHNGCAKNGTAFWSDNGGGIRVGTTGDGSSMGKCNYFDSQFPGGITGEWIKLKPNTDYIYSAKLWTANNIPGTSDRPLHFWCSSTQTSGHSALNIIDYSTNCIAQKWNDVYVHFKTVTSGNIWFKPFIWQSDVTGNFSVTELMLQEGSIKAPYSPHPSEVYDGVTMIDKNGVTVTASNANTKTNMSASGFKITKINNGEDIFRVDQQGLYLKGRLKIESVVDGINKDQLENNLKNDINNAVSDSSNALGQINNLQIGGRNLWKNTKEYDGSKYSGWVDNNSADRITTAPHTTIDGFGVQRIASPWLDMSQRVPIEANTEYTLSAWIKWENAQGEMNFYTNTGTKSGTSVTQQVGTTTYKRVAVTFNSQSGTVSTCRFECTSNTPYLIYGLKLEKGNKPTDWTPAPEDVSNRVEKTEQSISSLQDSIKLKVSQTDIDRSISNIKIGGRNLALGTNCNFTEPYTSFNGGTNTCVSVGKVLTKGLNVDDTVTVRLVYSYENINSADGHQASCWIQGSGNVTNWNAGAFNGSDRFNVSGTGEHTFLYHFTMSSNHIKNEYWDITIRHDYVKSGSIKWKEFKVEKGNKNTDWSPAPEDVDQSILDVYDNTSQLINEVTSNYESAINIMKDSIESTVSETYTTKDDFSTTVESISSKIDQQNDSITASITTATKQLSEDLQDYKDEVTSYMRFDEQGLELGKSNNKFKTRLSNEKLSFIEENQEVAYISNNKMNITDAEIKHQIIIGNFAFVPRSNGNMSLKWIRK